jgi:type II secretory pathway pseudopilin PulG
LVELLVVIGIAGVLMALLFPALSSAKEKSRRSVCNGNIRQFLGAVIMYGDDHDEYLPIATDNRGNYRSVRLSSTTFTNLVTYYLGNSNSMYCPNLVYATGTMGGYDPDSGYTIGYSYLAAVSLPAIPLGPDQVQSWTGPLKATDNGEVIADANYWCNPTASSSSSTSSAGTRSIQAMTVAPHTTGGGRVYAADSAAAGRSTTTASAVTPGASSTAGGAVGGNVGSLNGSVLWESMSKMKQYPASSTGGTLGNW